jgi:hypothetical protein
MRKIPLSHFLFHISPPLLPLASTDLLCRDFGRAIERTRCDKHNLPVELGGDRDSYYRE